MLLLFFFSLTAQSFLVSGAMGKIKANILHMLECTFVNVIKQLYYVQLSAGIVYIINLHHHHEWLCVILALASVCSTLFCYSGVGVIYRDYISFKFLVYLFTLTILYFVAINIICKFNIDGEFCTSRFAHSMIRQSRMNYDN